MDHSVTLPKHIQANLDFTYATKDYRIYINQLLNDSRDGKRQGFPPQVAKHLFYLLQEHDTKFPQYIPKPKPWDPQ